MFLRYINNFRAIACMFVVANHCIPALDWSNSFELSRLLKIIFSNGATLFVFISGYLFQHLLHKYEYKSFLISRFKLVVLPYLIISIPAIIVWTFMFNNTGLGIPRGFNQEPWWYQVGYYYLTGLHLGPVWFIPMIVLFYIASPVFILFDRYPILYWSIPLLLFYSWIQPRDWNPAIAFLHFLSPYVLGMFCSRHKEKLNHYLCKCWPLLILAFVALVYCEWTLTRGTMTYYNFWNKIVASLFFISVLAHFDKSLGGKLKPLADINFSIFFIHAYVITATRIIWLGKPSVVLPIDGTVINHLLYVTFIVIVCVLLILPARKILGKYSRYVIAA